MDLGNACESSPMRNLCLYEALLQFFQQQNVLEIPVQLCIFRAHKENILTGKYS